MKLSPISKFVLLISPMALTTASETYAQDKYPMLDKLALR